MAIAPSVNTVAGSQVARIWTYNDSTSDTIDHSNFNDPTSGSFISNVAPPKSKDRVSMQGETELVLVDGPTGEASIDVGFDGQWGACTIALRMVPVVERNVPTMSEWGLIGFAAFAGIAGIWYLRRRQVTA